MSGSQLGNFLTKGGYQSKITSHGTSHEQLRNVDPEDFQNWFGNGVADILAEVAVQKCLRDSAYLQRIEYID